MNNSLKWEEASTDSGFGSDFESKKTKQASLKIEESKRNRKVHCNHHHPPPLSSNEINSKWENVKFNDLEFVRVLGGGGYATVDLVQVVRNNRKEFFALKKLSTKLLTEQSQIKQLEAEKEILSKSQSRFIPKLYQTFFTHSHVFLLTEACMGGDMFTYLEKKGQMRSKSAKFVIGCVVNALHYLHHVLHCIHRDIKTENLLIGYSGLVKLGDLGFCKILEKPAVSSNTFCGTPGYTAPEIILNKPHSHKADYFSLGVVAFELLTCRSPFRRLTNIDTYKATLRGITDVAFPSLLDHVTQAFIRGLCFWDQDLRIGSEINSHEWFYGFDWEKLNAGKMTSPLLMNSL